MSYNFLRPTASKLQRAVYRLFSHKQITFTPPQRSRFRDFIGHIDPADFFYEKAVLAADLCSEALKTWEQKFAMSGRQKESIQKSQELEGYFKLSQEDGHKLSNLLSRYTSLLKEREALVYQMASFSSAVVSMGNVGEDAALAMSHITDAEKNQRALRVDIGYLSVERQELEDEGRFLERSLTFVKKLSIVVTMVFSVIAVFLAYVYMGGKHQVFYPTTVFVLLIILIISLLRLFKRRMSHELKQNMKKQQKAVALLNKKSAVFVHYTKFLNYEYKKYKVRSAKMLTTNLKDYKNYKHIAFRIDAIRGIMYETEKEITKTLKASNIDYSNLTIEQFAKTVNINDKSKFAEELMKEIKICQKDMDNLEDKHSKIWQQLNELKAQDDSNRTIGQLMQLYFIEVNKLLSQTDKELLEGDNGKRTRKKLQPKNC